MFKYRRHRIRENKTNSESKEEKEKQQAEISQKPPVKETNKTSSPKRYKYRRFYRRNKPTEEEVKADIPNKNENNNQPSESESQIQQVDDSNKDSELKNTSRFIIKSNKDEILKKLSEIVPIIEDREGEENNTPNKPNIKNDIDSKILAKNIYKNNFEKGEEDIVAENDKKLEKTASESFGTYKKFYDNELIDAILDVEKNNVNNFLSKDLAQIYDEICKDNVFFKNNVFLENVDNFEKKTGNLDKRRNKISMNFKEDIQYKLKQVPKTNEIINKFTEKTKLFN